MQQFHAIPSLVSFERTSMTTCWDMPGISRMGRFEKRMLQGFKGERHKAQKPMTLNDSMTLNVLFFIFFPSTRDSDKFRRSQQKSIPAIHPLGICILIPPMPLHLARCWWLLAGGVGEGLQGSTPWNSNCAVCNVTALFKDPAGLGERIRPQTDTFWAIQNSPWRHPGGLELGQRAPCSCLSQAALPTNDIRLQCFWKMLTSTSLDVHLGCWP